ncbi:hypothetical protein K9M74_05175, partial [Candidatus Woesearchaeota archaeon]|nr:hypothetical protein [Candidatus Woesearchaeota archaeon]
VKRMKKVFAVAATLGMVGATMVGALADLGNYPAPFVDEDGAFTGAIVVGANAATADVLGAIDIAASLQAEAKTGVAIAGGAVAVQGGDLIDTEDLNAVVTKTLTDSDVESLLDTTVRWNSGDYDVYEELHLGGMQVSTHYPGGSATDEFNSDPYLTVDTAGQIEYRYVFDEAIDPSAADVTFEDRNLELKLLGKSVKISAVTSATKDSIRVESSAETFMEQGDMVEVDGHEVTLKKVGTSSVLVTVDGETKAISDTATTATEFEQADYFKVELVSMFYIEGASDNSATLKLGEDLVKVVEDGEPMTLFGEPDDDNEAEWLWSINIQNSGNITQDDYIGAEQSIARTKLDLEDADEERPALAMGESLDFPNNYASISFSGWEDAVQSEYETLVIEPINTRINGSYVDAMRLSSSDDSDVFYVYNSSDDLQAKSSELYLVETATAELFDVWDDEKEILLADFNITENYIEFKLDSEAITIAVNDTAAWNLSDTNGEYFMLAAHHAVSFGATADEAEANDVVFVGTDISEDDKAYRTTYGIMWEDMESMMDSDMFRISVPTQQQKPAIAVTGRSSSVGVSEAGMSYTVNPISLGLGMLDTDATVGSKPMIVVGGPVINTAAAELMGNPTPDEIAETFSQGKAIIQWHEDQQAMLVAGYEAMETQGAAYVVARYGSYDFAGEELEVVVTSLNDIEVNAVE